MRCRLWLALIVLVLPLMPRAADALQGDCPGAPPTRLSPGIEARVILPGEGPDSLLRVRASPGVGGESLVDMRSGDTFAVIGGPECADGYGWWAVVTAGGVRGWSAEGTPRMYFVEPTGSPAPDPLPQAPERLERVMGAGQGTALAWSPDGQTLAVGTARGVWLYSPALEPLRLLEGAPVTALAWRPDGAALAAGDVNGAITLWDAASGAPIWTAEHAHPGPLIGLDWSSDGARIASATRAAVVRVRDGASGAEIAALPLEGEVTSLDWSPDGARLAAGYRLGESEAAQGRVQVWDAADLSPRTAYPTPEELLTSPGYDPNLGVRWSPGGERLAVSHPCGLFVLWDPASGAVDYLDSMALDTWCVEAFDWKPDGSGLVWSIGAGWGASQIYDARYEPFALDDAPVRALAARPGSGEVAVLSAGDLSVLDAASLSLLRAAEDEFAPPNLRTDASGQITTEPWPGFAPDMHATITGTQVEVRRGGLLITTIDAAPYCGDETWEGVRADQFSPDGTKIVIVCGRTGVSVWDTSGGQHLATLEPPATVPDEVVQYVDMAYFLDDVQWTADGSRLYAAVRNDTRGSVMAVPRYFGFYVWDWSGGQMIFSHVGPAADSGAAWDTYQQYFAVLDGTRLTVWDSTTWRAVTVREVGRVSPALLSWSSDQAHITALSAERDDVLIWDLSAGGTLTLHGHAEPVTMLCFSHDGSRLASGDAAGTVRVWDALSGQLLYTFDGGAGWIHDLYWSALNDQLGASNSDGIVRVWSVP